MSCLDAMKLSDLQKAPAVDDRSPLLVAAGAGSGKTRLLVAYFVRALVEEGMQPEQLVAVTFTRKAAAELVGRIRTNLEDLGRSDLARSLDRATVGTIHGLCRRLVRERALQTDTDPAAGVLEAEAASLVKEKLSRRVWDKVAEQATDEQLGVLALAGDKLRRQVVPLYERLRGIGQESPQIVVASGPENNGDDPGSAVSLQTATDELREAIGAALVAACGCQRITATLRKDLDGLERCLDWLDKPLRAERRAVEIDDTLGFFPSKRTPAMEAFFQPVRLALTGYRQALAELRLRPLVAAMNSLLAEFHVAYEAHKQEKGLLDFSDLELRARRLASVAAKDGLPVLPPGSRLLVDEFQDTNPLQYSILEGLGASRLLMVGDERQSIYRFRGADVEVFRALESELWLPRRGEDRGRVHRLDVNYRSRPEVLAFVNRLFAHRTFFGGRFVALCEPEPSADDPVEPVEYASPAVEVVFVQRGGEADDATATESIQDAEADELATRVRRLVDEEGWSQSEITILLPAQTHVEVYQRALVSRGIDVYVVGGKGYYSQEEVSDVVALLRLLVNPHDDLALVAALRSPLAGLSDDGLYLLGQVDRKTRGSLWEVIRMGGAPTLGVEDSGRLALFTERLFALRGRVGRPGLARLIDEAVSCCDYDLCLLGLAQGKRRFANIRKMMRMASEFESVEGPDLAGFVDLLESMDDLSDREGSAPTLAEGEDVVRIMTIHQAKGLEFPVVLLAGLGADVRTSDAADFMVAGDGRIGAFLRGSKRDRYEEQDLSWGPAGAILEEERAKEREEDVRLLYVAMTRAEKRLVLIGAKPRSDDLEKSRIGRVLRALGFDSLPETGDDLMLPGLDAVISTPARSAEPQAVPLGRGRAAPSPPAAGGPPHPYPRFLQIDAGGAAPAQRLSFSALSAYHRCPRGYYLERVLGLGFDDGHGAVPAAAAQEPDADGHLEPATNELLLDEHERQSGRDIGLAVHALLERLPRGAGRPSEASTRELAATWVLEAGVRLMGAELQTAIGLTRAFWDSPVATLRASDDTVLEVPFLFGHGEIGVLGRNGPSPS